VRADAIVNAANPELRGGAGVDGAIHRAGGPSLMEELRQIRRTYGPCPAGSAVVTGAGRLKARHVIHAVGPIWQGGKAGERDLLARAYRESLRLADERGCVSVAFPAISTGVYGYPLEQAAPLALETVRDFLGQARSVRDVTFVLFGEESFQAFGKALEEIRAEK